MCQQVEWTSEKECFDSFLRELAVFYTPTPLLPFATDLQGADNDNSDTPSISDSTLSRSTDEQKWQIQHVIFPAMQRYLMPPVRLVNSNSIKQVASMESLFRVFERC